MTKEQVITTLEDLPPAFEADQLIERLVALRNMEEGLQQVRHGEVVTMEEVKQRLAKWLI